jgi:carbamoyltransferase
MEKIAPEELVIGSKFWGHDSSVFMVMPKERRIAGIETERVTRYKHDRVFAIPALTKLIEREAIATHAVRRVIFCNSFEVLQSARLPENLYEIEMGFRRHFRSPYQKDIEAARERFNTLSPLRQVWDLLATPSGWSVLGHKALLALHLKKVKSLAEIEKNVLKRLFPHAEIEIRFYEHEFCHVACASVTSPFDEALVVSIDGWGDKHFSNAYTYKNRNLELIAKSPRTFSEAELKILPDYLPSIGGLYSYFTKQLGFVPEQDEGKVEALAAYGKPAPEILKQLHSLVSMDAQPSLQVDNKKFVEYFAPERFTRLIEQHKKEDLSATIQIFLEEVMHTYIAKLVEKTSMKSIAFAGGIAANVINNLNVYEHITPNIHITPAMGDDGSAQGAAFAYLLEKGEDLAWIKQMEMPYYSTTYTRAEVQETLEHSKEIVFKDLGGAWPERAGELIAEGKIGAIFHGRMEWGPRALGHRSIVADPRRKDFRDVINKTIKRRPLFQPFCPSILAEERERLFESAYMNKHMTCAFRLKKEFWEALPSAIHIDGTARAQFVEEKDDANYYRLLKKVKELTGFGIVINTSFNKHGRTIVETPEDALRDFLDTDMDYLIIEGFLVKRK